MSFTTKKGEVEEQLGAFTKQGNLLGPVTSDSESQAADGQQINLKFALAVDGNRHAVWNYNL